MSIDIFHETMEASEELEEFLNFNSAVEQQSQYPQKFLLPSTSTQLRHSTSSQSRPSTSSQSHPSTSSQSHNQTAQPPTPKNANNPFLNQMNLVLQQINKNFAEINKKLGKCI